MEAGTYFVYGVLGLLLLGAFAVLLSPVRRALKALAHMALGFAGLLMCNVCGGLLGVTVGVNLANTLLVALLGPAGLPLLLLLGWSLP